ncbi:zinc ribbon domain-containing protein [Clostridium boliviensis]|uniref:Zinc ribbon domain-containing protein n=2 Tax=Clostridium boliviensis TaxID=318465 RepID=A0ABU4GLW3_9CLOT|nr:zinc ribbon domain-containing protein [Clostridium boliviensis]MDW2798589.1 zinc ribbon domain-containing protein [Clostridium boliviensis]
MSAAISYKCPNCGGPLKFNPQKQKYACEYCLSEFAENALLNEEKESKGETLLYNCPSCGAEIVTDDTTAASFCYYCHNPVILSGKLSGEFHPDYVIPFSLDKKEAVGIFRDWMKKKRYVPKAFYSEEQIEKITGVYFPYLLYSCLTKGSLEASADRVRVWVSGDRRYTETQTYEVLRSGDMSVRYVPRNALKKANRKLAEGVLPFETDKLKPFTMGYLSGFVAERRDMEEQEFTDEVKMEIRNFAEDTLRNSITSYDSVRVRNQDIQLEDESWEYALLPVWTLTYRDEARDRIYYFTINGQTGKVCGELPVDKGKLMLLFAKVFVPVCLLLLLAGYFV